MAQGAANITITLGADLTMTGNASLTAGILDLNGFVLTCLSFPSTAANARTLAFGATGIIRCTRTTSAIVFDIFNASVPATITGTPVVELTGAPLAGVTRTVRPSGTSPANPITVRIKAGSDTINMSAGFGYKDLDFTGFSGTLANTAIRLYGALTLSAGMTLTAGANTLSLLATSGTITHTFNGKTLNFPVTFNAPGSTQVLSDALTVGATRTLTLTAGTIKFKSGVTSSAGTFVIAGSPSVTLNAITDGSAATISQTTGTVNASNATIKDINATGGATWNAFTNRQNIDDGNNDGWNFLSIPYPVFGSIFRLIFKPVIQ
jgi:hypothetical protein